MSQSYAVELYFDPALENQVLKAWNVLARRQISTQLIEIESRPHLTLFWSDFVDVAKLENALRIVGSKQEPLALSFSSIGSLPNDNNVLFLAPTPSASLLQFHSQLCDAMKKEGIEIGEDYRPDKWIPHCLVAQEVPKNRMPEAFTVLRDLKLPVGGYATEISLVEYQPVRELFSLTLALRFCYLWRSSIGRDFFQNEKEERSGHNIDVNVFLIRNEQRSLDATLGEMSVEYVDDRLVSHFVPNEYRLP